MRRGVRLRPLCFAPIPRCRSLIESPMTEAVLRPFVWMDYRLALLLTVVLPLVFWIWAMVKQFDAIQRFMGIYWKVASLLAITVYLMIAALPIGFLTATLARLLLLVTLWFWVDINDDVHDMQPWRPLRMGFNAWRWAMTFYCALSAAFSLVFVRCAFLNQASVLGDSLCRVWIDAPWGYKTIFHRGATPGLLGFLGIVTLVVYGAYFAYFLLVKLGRKGRSASGY